jgi:hypothetical protein
MRHSPALYLPVRPAFLLTAQLPYDDLLKRPGAFAGRLYGCAFGSAEGCEALSRLVNPTARNVRATGSRKRTAPECTRTLQRRLTDQGITFQRLLDEARRELARHYLHHSSRELNETAYLLGYEDSNSFFRAFHHWEGTSPGGDCFKRTHRRQRKHKLA